MWHTISSADETWFEIDTPVLTRYKITETLPKKEHLRGVMMDMDGSSTDTEKLVLEAMRLMMGSALHDPDFRFAPEDYPNIIGDSTTNHVTWLIGKYHLQLSLRDELIALYYQHYHATLEQIRDGGITDRLIEPMPFLKEFLSGVRERGIKVGLVTSSLQKEVDIVMPEVFRGLGWDNVDYHDFYDGVISADSVGEPFLKPHPNLYVLMAEQLGIQPENGFVIEDSTAGIMAARLAGFAVFGVPHTDNKDHDFSYANLGLAHGGLSEVWQAMFE